MIKAIIFHTGFRIVKYSLLSLNFTGLSHRNISIISKKIPQGIDLSPEVFYIICNFCFFGMTVFNSIHERNI